MVLRSLTITGFKSFADTTTIHFGEGITAILGPNGCGKSNVVDAIRWVFGEQRASALRSSSMQDVIFSGTQKRQPQGMAEVTLVIENTRKILPVEYSQVGITRRLFRTGESEYLLNKVPCRLRDIQELFVDTGIGTTAYTTIENNMISLILSDKAEERRQLFDEAAGIGKYKQRRKESQRQLEKTTQDLVRLNDMVQECERQVRMLSRHVEKARRYRAYQEELKKLEVGYENRRYRELGRVMAERYAQLQEKVTAREMTRAAIAAAESEIQVKELEAREVEEELQRAAAAVAEVGEQINALDREISVTEERRRGAMATLERLAQELSQLGERIEQRSQLREQIEKAVAERMARSAECATRLAAARDELAQCDAAIGRVRAEVDRLSASQIAALKAFGDTRNELANLEAGLSNLYERTDRLQRENSALEARIAQYAETVERCRQQLALVTDAHERLCQSRETLLERIEKEEAALQKLVEREKQCEAQIDADKAQLRFLEGLDAAFEGYESGVRALLTSGLPGLLGTAADCLQVSDSEVIGLVERALGQAVQTVVFERNEHVAAAVEYLAQRTAGAARMVSLERLNSRPRVVEESADSKGESLRALVGAVPGREVVADYLLGSVRIVQTTAEALQYSAVASHESVFVSRDGAVCRGDGTVVAGRGAGDEAGLLRRKAQIERLRRDIERLEREYRTIVAEKEACIITRDEAKYALAEVDEKISRGRQEKQAQETTIRHHEREIEINRARLEEQRAEAAELEASVQKQRDLVAACRIRMEERKAEVEAVERQLNAARETVSKMQSERQEKAAHLRNIELEAQGLENQIGQNRADLERLARELVEYEERRRRIGAEQEATAAAIKQHEERLVALREELRSARNRREELEAATAAVRERYNGIQMIADEKRKQVRTQQQELETINAAIHELEMEQARDEQERRRIRERIYEVHEVDLESADELPVIEEDPGVVEQIQILRERIKRVGEVNMGALEDFEAESARLQQLTAQRNDLQTAVDDLTKAIKKLDREARAQFLATFEQVRKNFAEMFTTLFEGGEATLELEPDKDPLEANILINARPAGKKMRGVQPLSGGERALTAIALLFGLYMVRPSAYCILDELDAPLDDANIERFARILRRFCDRTQFIVITHNKRTMEAADMLYGVTQQERGVSKIVSVKLEDALLQAA